MTEWGIMWNAAITVFLGVISWAAKLKEKEFDDAKAEVQRLGILLNRTRDEIAKLPADIALDLGIYKGDAHRIAHEAVYGLGA